MSGWLRKRSSRNAWRSWAWSWEILAIVDVLGLLRTAELPNAGRRTVPEPRLERKWLRANPRLPSPLARYARVRCLALQVRQLLPRPFQSPIDFIQRASHVVARRVLLCILPPLHLQVEDVVLQPPEGRAPRLLRLSVVRVHLLALVAQPLLPLLAHTVSRSLPCLVQLPRLLHPRQLQLRARHLRAPLVHRQPRLPR